VDMAASVRQVLQAVRGITPVMRYKSRQHEEETVASRCRVYGASASAIARASPSYRAAIFTRAGKEAIAPARALQAQPAVVRRHALPETAGPLLS